jgi:hypothetical protein
MIIELEILCIPILNIRVLVHIILCDLFYDIVCLYVLWRRVVGRLVNNELERIWKEAAVALLGY